MSVSSAVTKDGKQKIYVMFHDGERQAECTLPDYGVVKNEGFREDEIEQLLDYMKREKQTILEQARSVNVMSAFMGKKKDTDGSTH
ncbi:MAG: hypothetical protein K6F35_12470 [Lachnospiraceae bacterium]|nr:hypothetical protein [Lachnospiraceae bacterium]